MTGETDRDAEAELFDVDAAAFVDRLRDRAEGTVFSVAEYDVEGYNLLHLDPATLAFYDDREAMHDHFAEIHSYVHVDFTEVELFTDTLFPVAEGVEFVTTRMDVGKFVRFYDADHERGLFLSLEPDEEVEPLADVVRDALDRE